MKQSPALRVEAGLGRMNARNSSGCGCLTYSGWRATGGGSRSRVGSDCRKMVITITLVAVLVFAGCAEDTGVVGDAVNGAPVKKVYSDGRTLETSYDDKGLVHFSLYDTGTGEVICEGGGWSKYQNWLLYYDVDTKYIWSDNEVGLEVHYPDEKGEYVLHYYGSAWGTGEVALPKGLPTIAPAEFTKHLTDRARRNLNKALEKAREKMGDIGTPS